VDATAIFPVAPAAIAIAVLVTAFAAAVQGTIGFAFAIVSVPVLSLVDPALAPVPQMLVTLPMTVSMAWRERHAIEPRGILWVLVGRFPGAGLGLVVLALDQDGRVVDVALALMVLAAVAILATGVTVRRSAGTELAAGVASGIFGLVSAIGGPPLAMLYRDESGPSLRANLAAIFSIGLCITLAARAAAAEITPRDAHVAVWIFPAMVVGLWSSRWTKGRVEGRPLRTAILVVSALAAVGLLVRTLC